MEAFLARSPKTRSTRRTRKPVTIDLEAQAVDAAQKEAEATSSAVSGTGDAEPVAFENLNESPDAASKANTETEDADPNQASDDSPSKAQIAASGGSNRGSALTGGLVGGLLALIGGAGLQWIGLLPNMGGTEPQPQIDLTPLQLEIDALKAEVEASGNRTNVQLSSVPAALKSAVDAATATSGDALGGVEELKTTVTGLTEKIASIESAVSSGGAGENAGLEALSARLDTLEQDVESKLAGGSGTSGTDLEAALAPTNKKINQFDGMINAFGSKILDVERKLDARINSLDEKMSGFDKKIAEAASQAEQSGGGNAVAAAIAAAGLKSAIDRGGSFMAELEAFATVSEDQPLLDALRDYAAAGVPTINQLSEDFPAVANQIVATGQGLAEDAGIADRLMASARSLVQVRPKGEVKGDTPGAVAARVESRLLESDLDGAISEFEALPDAAKTEVADFADKMRARQAVDALVAQALTGAMASTAPAAN